MTSTRNQKANGVQACALCYWLIAPLIHSITQRTYLFNYHYHIRDPVSALIRHKLSQAGLRPEVRRRAGEALHIAKSQNQTTCFFLSLQFFPLMRDTAVRVYMFEKINESGGKKIPTTVPIRDI